MVVSRSVLLTGQHRQDYGVQHDRHHHAAEEIAAVPVHQVPPALGLTHLYALHIAPPRLCAAGG